MLIEAVVADIQLPADEPLREWFLPLQSRFEGLEPNQLLLCDLRPKFLGVLHRRIVNLFVLRERFDVGALRKLLRRFETTVFSRHRSDVHHSGGGWRRGGGLVFLTHTEKSASS